MTKTRAIALSATLAALTLNVASAADEYQWEAGLGFTLAKDDTTPETKSTAITASGEYHFAPVKLGDHPYEEAAFLEHSTFVDADVSYLKSKQSGAFDAKGEGIHAGFTYATPEFPVRLAVGLGFSKISDNGDQKTTSFELDAGYWIKPELIAGLRLGSSKIVTTGSADNKELDVTAYGKWVINMNDDLAFNAEAELGRNTYDAATKDSNIAFGVAGDVYYRQQYGIGLALGTESGDADAAAGTTIGVRASAWFTTQIGVRLGFEKFAISDDKKGVDNDTLFLELVGRF